MQRGDSHQMPVSVLGVASSLSLFPSCREISSDQHSIYCCTTQRICQVRLLLVYAVVKRIRTPWSLVHRSMSIVHDAGTVHDTVEHNKGLVVCSVAMTSQVV